MYRNAYQRGMLTVFFSCGSKPLNIWETHTQDGYISRFLDQDIKSMVLEIGGTNVSTTYMTCPKGNQVLGITMPFLVMIVKNLKKYFSFEVTILDETGTRRRFRVSNFQSTTQILPLCTVMPIGLSDGWNQIQFNLAEFTRRAYKKQYVEVQKIKINANIRLRRIYFTERLVPEDQLPPEYKLYFPLPSKGAKGKKGVVDTKDKENIEEAPAEKQEEVKPEEVKSSKTEFVKQAVSKVSVEKVSEEPPPETEDGRKPSVTKDSEEAPATETEVATGEGETALTEGAEAATEPGETQEDEVPTENEAAPGEASEKEDLGPEAAATEPETGTEVEPAPVAEEEAAPTAEAESAPTAEAEQPPAE